MVDLWSELHSDLLEFIVTSESLTIKDVSSFASVCQSWRSAASATAKHRRYHSPWLLFVDKEDPNSAKFYDLSKNQIFSLPNQPNPSIANRYFIGSAHGWLITADEKSELSLLNPLTRQQIDLPPITTISNYVRPCNRNGKIIGYSLKVSCGRCRFDLETLRYFLFERAALYMAADSAYYLVAIYLTESSNLAVARSGDKKWTVVKESGLTTDIAFHDDGKLYTTGYNVEVKSWDFHKQEDLSLVKPESLYFKEMKPNKLAYLFYIVRSPVGELLLVRREKFDRTGDEDVADEDVADEDVTDEDVADIPPDLFMRTVKIKVWRIDNCNIGDDGHDDGRIDRLNKKKLVRLSSLGDYALFLGGHMSTCLSSKDYPELRPNCAYLSDEFLEHTYHHQDSTWKDVGIFDLNDGSFQRILPHDTRLCWPSPTWFTPHWWWYKL